MPASTSGGPPAAKSHTRPSVSPAATSRRPSGVNLTASSGVPTRPAGSPGGVRSHPPGTATRRTARPSAPTSHTRTPSSSYRRSPPGNSSNRTAPAG
jgi:hypothetical protein